MLQYQQSSLGLKSSLLHVLDTKHFISPQGKRNTHTSRYFTLVLAFINTWLSISLLDLLWATPAFLIASSLKKKKIMLGINWGHQKILSVVRNVCVTAFYPSLIVKSMYRLKKQKWRYLKLLLFKTYSNNWGKKSFFCCLLEISSLQIFKNI